MTHRVLLRFRVKHLMFLFALVAIGFWVVPEAYLELTWRPERKKLAAWVNRIDRTDGKNHITVVISRGRVFAISTRPSITHPELDSSLGTVHRDFPSHTTYGVDTQSPYGSHAGFFITPQCVWVESTDEAIRRWKRTSESDWERYRSIYTSADPRLDAR